MDKNPRAVPARASAQIGIVIGALMAVMGGGAFTLIFFSGSEVTIGQGYPAWIAAGVVALAGVALTIGSYILRRRVQNRDASRSQHAANPTSSQ